MKLQNIKQQKNPTTLKLVLKGEVVENEIVYTTLAGEVIKYTETRRIVVPSKKNDKEIITNKHTGKMYLINSQQHVKWYNEHRKIFDEWYHKLYSGKTRLPIVRCKAKVLFYFPDSGSRDLTNKVETIADILVDSGILADDDFKVLKPVYIDGWVNRARPRTEIYITIIEPTSKEYEWDITPTSYEAKKKERKNLRQKINRDMTKRKSTK